MVRPGPERQHAQQRRDEEQHHVAAFEPEHQRLVEQIGRRGDRRHGQADGRERRAQRKIDAFLQVVLARGSQRRDAFRQQDQQRDHDTGESRRRMDRGRTGIHHQRELLRKQHHRQKRKQQEANAQDKLTARSRGMFGGLFFGLDNEVVAMEHRLRVEENAVKNECDHAYEDELAG